MARVVVGMLLFLCFFNAKANDTVLKLYRPFGESLNNVSPLVKNSLRGECIEQSHLILREDAWRCQAQGRRFDPCFFQLTGKGNQVICPSSPWMADSIQIQVDAPLHNEQHRPLDMSSAYPWALELSNGEKCQAIEPDTLYEQMPVRYQCGANNFLIGHLQRCKPGWSMLEKTTQGVVQVNVKVAWF